MKKIVLTFGLLAAAINMVGWFALNAIAGSPTDMENFDFQTGEILGYAAMLLALSMIFFGILRYRNQVLDGFISFKKAFLTGLYITLIASVIYVIGWMIYYPNFMPDFADQYEQAQIEKIEQKDISEEEKQEEIAETKEWMDMYQNPAVMSVITFLEIFPVGLVISLISAFILKRKPKNESKIEEAAAQG